MQNGTLDLVLNETGRLAGVGWVIPTLTPSVLYPNTNRYPEDTNTNTDTTTSDEIFDIVVCGLFLIVLPMFLRSYIFKRALDYTYHKFHTGGDAGDEIPMQETNPDAGHEILQEQQSALFRLPHNHNQLPQGDNENQIGPIGPTFIV